MYLGRRIIIVGLSGAGKTSLANELSSLLHVPWTKIDGLVLDEHIHLKPLKEIETALATIGRGDEWIVEGPWWFVPSHVWKRATTIIWLHYPRTILGWRVLKRAWSEALIWRRGLWGNLKHTLLKHGENRRNLKGHLDACRQTGTNLFQIRTPWASQQFLLSVRKVGGDGTHAYDDVQTPLARLIDRLRTEQDERFGVGAGRTRR